MGKDVNIDNTIRTALERSTENLHVSAYMFENLQNQLKEDKKQETATFNTVFTIKLFPMAACFAAVLCLIFVLTPQSRSWAAEGITKLYFAILGENGYEIQEKDVLGVISNDGFIVEMKDSGDVVETRVARNITPSINKTKLTASKLYEKLGYVVKLPLTLSGDYTLSGKAITEIGENTLFMADYKNEDKIFLVTCNQPLYINSRAAIKILDKECAWSEYPIKLDEHNKIIFSLAEKPADVKTNHILYWADSGVYYALMDVGSNISMDEMSKMAADVMKAD